MPPKQREGGHKRWNLVLKPDTDSEKHDIFTDMRDNLYTDEDLQKFFKPNADEKDVQVYQSVKIDGIAGLMILLVAKKADQFQCIPFNNHDDHNMYFSVYKKTAKIDFDWIEKINESQTAKKKLDTDCYNWLTSLKEDNIESRVLKTEDFRALNVDEAPTNCTTDSSSNSPLQYLKLLLAIGAPDYFVWQHNIYFFKFMMLDQTDCTPIVTSLDMQIKIFDELIEKLPKAGFDDTKNIGRWIARVEKILPVKGHRSNEGQRNRQSLENDSAEEFMEDESSTTKNLMSTFHHALNKNIRFSLVMLQDMDNHVQENAWKCFVNKNVRDEAIVNLTKQGNIFPHSENEFIIPVLGKKGEGSELELVDSKNVMFVPYSRTLTTKNDFESCFKKSREMAVKNGLEGFVLHRKTSDTLSKARKLKFVQEKICLKSLLSADKSEPWKVSTHCEMSMFLLFDVYLPAKYIKNGTTLLRFDEAISEKQKYQQYVEMRKTQSKDAIEIKAKLNRREKSHPLARLCVDEYPAFRKNFSPTLNKTNVPNSVLSMHHVQYYEFKKDENALASTLPDDQQILTNLQQLFLLEGEGEAQEIKHTDLSNMILRGLRSAHNIVFDKDKSSISLDIEMVLEKIHILQNSLSYFNEKDKVGDLIDHTQWVNILSQPTEKQNQDQMQEDRPEEEMQEVQDHETKLKLSTSNPTNSWFHRLFTWFSWNTLLSKLQSPNKKTPVKQFSLFAGKNPKRWIYYENKKTNNENKKTNTAEKENSMVATVADGVMISNVNTTFTRGQNYVSDTSSATAKLRTSVTEGARSNMRSLTDSLSSLSFEIIKRPEHTQIAINDIFLECFIIMLVVAALDAKTFNFQTAGESFSNTLRHILIEFVVWEAKKEDNESDTDIYAQNIKDMKWPAEGWLNRINANRKELYNVIHGDELSNAGDVDMIDRTSADHPEKEASSEKEAKTQKQPVLKINLTPEIKCKISKLWRNKLQQKMNENIGVVDFVRGFLGGKSSSISREELLKHYEQLSKDLNLKNIFTANSAVVLPQC